MISTRLATRPVTEEPTAVARSADRRVTEVMSWALLTVPATQSCKEVRALAAQRAVHHVPVLDGGVLVGLVCTCDLRGAREAEPISKRMRSPVLTVSAHAPCKEARAMMQAHDVDALPVLYHGFLIGIVTTGDLVRAHAWPAEERLTCSACGAHHHVRSDATGARCLACRERTQP